MSVRSNFWRFSVRPQCGRFRFQPKLNLLSRFNPLKYFKDDNLWSPVSPLPGEIDICTHKPFRMKFNAQQLLLEPFFDIMRIFSSIELYSESSFPF